MTKIIENICFISLFVYFFTDISLYDNALETESEVSLPNKMSQNGNIFLYFGILMSIIILVIAVLLQLSR